MESCNGRLLQLIDCIDSRLNEVKRKMIETRRAIVHHSHCTQRTQEKIGDAIVSGACEHSLSTRFTVRRRAANARFLLQPKTVLSTGIGFAHRLLRDHRCRFRGLERQRNREDGACARSVGALDVAAMLPQYRLADAQS
jgi:hypothetical protein